MVNPKIQIKPDKKLTNGNPPKWVIFTYIGKETTYITKIFKHTNIKIAYLTNNTIQGNNSQNP